MASTPFIRTFDLDGVFSWTRVRREDDRGVFVETFRRSEFDLVQAGLELVQDNLSLSNSVGTVRGLHFQLEPHAQAKLVSVPQGAVLDVAVDIRPGSPTFGRHVALELSAENATQLFVPAGFAHGFCTLRPNTIVAYKVSAYYDGPSDRGLAWDDPALGIDWPVTPEAAQLSPKDRTHPRLAELARSLGHG